MKPAILIPVVVGALLLAGCTSGGASSSTQPLAEEKPTNTATDAAGTNGQIVFQRIDPQLADTTVYAINPDGSHEYQLFDRRSEFPHWSPDGAKVSISIPHQETIERGARGYVQPITNCAAHTAPVGYETVVGHECRRKSCWRRCT